MTAFPKRVELYDHSVRIDDTYLEQPGVYTPATGDDLAGKLTLEFPIDTATLEPDGMTTVAWAYPTRWWFGPQTTIEWPSTARMDLLIDKERTIVTDYRTATLHPEVRTTTLDLINFVAEKLYGLSTGLTP